MSEAPGRVRRVEAAPGPTREAAEEAIELWGGASQHRDDGLDLELPVQAGLRHGWLRGRLRLVPEAGGTRLELQVDEVRYRLHRPAVSLLAIAAVAALATLLWPWFPVLSGLLPLALILGFGAWFLVVARLQNRGAEELLATIAQLADGGEPPPLS